MDGVLWVAWSINPSGVKFLFLTFLAKSVIVWSRGVLLPQVAGNERIIWPLLQKQTLVDKATGRKFMPDKVRKRCWWTLSEVEI